MKGMKCAFVLIFVWTLCLVAQFGSPDAFAQQTINYASVSGQVVDSTTAVVQGAQVTARQTETNLSNTAKTDPEGRFRFPYLRPGPYEISVKAPGFSEMTRSVTLTLGAAFEIRFCHVVRFNKTALAARLDYHVRHGEPRFHRKMFDRLTCKLHIPIKGAIEGNLSDRIED